MIKYLVLSLIFFISINLQAEIIDTKNHEFLGETRLFVVKPDYQLLGDFKLYEPFSKEKFYLTSKLGVRKKANDNFIVGAFYQRDEGDNSALADFTYKNLLTSELTYEARLTYEHNFTSKYNYAKPRIGTSYFFSNSHITFQYELTFPLEKSEKTIQEYWSYLNYSYHVNENLFIGPFASYTISEYEYTEKVFYYGLNLTYYWE